jgi:uncharacterized protein YjbJ (UPF0337 family)
MSSGRTDEVKGRLKEAAGALTGDERLKRDGIADQAAAKLKKAVEDVQEKTEDVIDRVKDALN